MNHDDWLPNNIALYRGPAGDRNGAGTAGAGVVVAALAQRLGSEPKLIGSPGRSPDSHWRAELDVARYDLGRLGEQFDRWLQQGKVVFSGLPRCTASLATVPVVARHYPDVCLLWIDAHGDLNTPAESTSGDLGGMALAGAAGLWDSGLGSDMPLNQTLLIGARALDWPEQARIDAGEVLHMGCGDIEADRLRALIAGRPVYVHIDCDALEPGLVPTENAVADGLSFEQLGVIAEVLRNERFVGLEIAEFQTHWPDGEQAAPTAMLDALSPIVARYAAEC